MLGIDGMVVWLFWVFDSLPFSLLLRDHIGVGETTRNWTFVSGVISFGGPRFLSIQFIHHSVLIKFNLAPRLRKRG